MVVAVVNALVVVAVAAALSRLSWWKRSERERLHLPDAPYAPLRSKKGTQTRSRGDRIDDEPFAGKNGSYSSLSCFLFVLAHQQMVPARKRRRAILRPTKERRNGAVLSRVLRRRQAERSRTSRESCWGRTPPQCLSTILSRSAGTAYVVPTYLHIVGFSSARPSFGQQGLERVLLVFRITRILRVQGGKGVDMTSKCGIIPTTILRSFFSPFAVPPFLVNPNRHLGTPYTRTIGPKPTGS